MTEENRREELAEQAAVPAAAQADAADEPREIVSWYTPEDSAEEVVEYYVHADPLPERLCPKAAPSVDSRVWREAAQREKKRRRRGLWAFLACMVLLVGVIVGSVLLQKGKGGGNADWEGNLPSLPDSEEGNASSIVDITRDKRTTIARYTGDASVRLTITPERGKVLEATEVYTKVNPSVVTVVSEEGNGTGSVGTGVILTEDGYIITNAHVISGGKTCWVALDSGVSYEAKLVGYDEEEDLAVLKAVDAEGLHAAEFGNSDDLLVGEKVYAIGNPLGMELRGTLTDGILSAVNRQVEVEGGGSMTMLQTTAALNNGNSGGPLINSSGQIVGINTLKMSGSGWEGEATVEGLGFAIPISSATFVINDLIAYGQFRGVPTIGISVITANRDDGKGTQVVVYSVEENYGAQEAGVQAGDVVLAADGQSIYQTADLLAVRRGHIIGDTMTLTLLRDGQTIEVEIVLYSSRER